MFHVHSVLAAFTKKTNGDQKTMIDQVVRSLERVPNTATSSLGKQSSTNDQKWLLNLQIDEGVSFDDYCSSTRQVTRNFCANI